MAEPALVSIDIIYARKVSWSQMRAGLPLVLRLDMRLSDCMSDRTLEIDLSTNGFTTQSRRETVTLRPYKQEPLGNISLDWDFDRAAYLSHTKSNILRFKIRDSETNRWASISLPLQLLALTEWDCAVDIDGTGTFCRSSIIEVCKAKLEYAPPARLVSKVRLEKGVWDWQGRPPLEAAAVSLIFPTHPAFDNALKSEFQKATELLGESEVHQVASEEEKVVKVVKASLQAAYMTLLHQFPNVFHVGEMKRFHERFQPIRLPDQILVRRWLPNWLQWRGATCIDYALSFCGWLEFNEMEPLLILLSGDGKELHAMVGVWLEPPPEGTEAILDRAAFFKRRNDIEVVDITFWTSSTGYGGAVKKANELLEQTEEHPDWFCYAVSVLDARRLHPYEDSIEPLPLPQRRRVWPLVLILIYVTIIILAIIFWPTCTNELFHPEITRLNNMAVIQHQAEIISGGETVEFNLAGKLKPNHCDSDEVFVLLEKTGDPSTQVLGPAQRADDAWSLPMKLSIDGGGDMARFELTPFVVEQSQTINEKLSLLREQARENNLGVKIVMRKASLTIEKVSVAGAYAHVCVKAANLADGIIVDAQTAFTTLDDWRRRAGKAIKGNAWEMTDVPLRDPNQSAGNVKLRVVLPQQEGVLLMGNEIVAEHKQHISLLNPQLRITECDMPPRSSERNAAGLRPSSSITIRGVAENALVNDTIWALVIVSGTVNGQNHIWPDRNSIILTEAQKRNENGVINWTQTIPIYDVGYVIDNFRALANISTDPPPSDLKITLATEGQTCPPKNKKEVKRL